MSNVVDFRTVSGARVIIETDIISKTVTQSERGTEVVVHPPGLRWYFVDVVEPDGRQQVWDGSSYAQAKAAARECSIDWGCAPIIDRCLS